MCSTLRPWDWERMGEQLKNQVSSDFFFTSQWNKLSWESLRSQSTRKNWMGPGDYPDYTFKRGRGWSLSGRKPGALVTSLLWRCFYGALVQGCQSNPGCVSIKSSLSHITLSTHQGSWICVIDQVLESVSRKPVTQVLITSHLNKLQGTFGKKRTWPSIE